MSNKIQNLTPATEKYLIRMYFLFEEGKLVHREQLQLFQDLLDSKMAFKMGPEVIELCNLFQQYQKFEAGKLSYTEQVELFQGLLNSGVVDKMDPEIIDFTKRLLQAELIEEKKVSKSNAN